MAFRTEKEEEREILKEKAESGRRRAREIVILVCVVLTRTVFVPLSALSTGHV